MKLNEIIGTMAKNDPAEDLEEGLRDRALTVISRMSAGLKKIGISEVPEKVLMNYFFDEKGAGNYKATKLFKDLKKIGFKDNAESYEENKEFYDRIGITRNDHNLLVKASNEKV